MRIASRFALIVMAFVCSLDAQVTFDRLLKADREPQNWMTYSGGMGSQRYSQLNQINANNVKDLQLKWAFQQRSSEKFEATPLVVDGTMYLTQAPNDIIALDAASGKVKWIYSYSPSKETRVCCGRVNRGVAILGDALFMATIDAHLVAVDARDGKLLWNKEVAKPEAGYSMTNAPLVIKDKVVVGVAGGEFGIRGFIAAYNAATGNEDWKFYTIPGPGEPGHETWKGDPDAWQHGGASVWVTGSYDPSTNLTFWGIGNPGPDLNADKRQGDNLYSDCVVALDADTGKLKWYFQFTPNDVWDYDSTQVPVLADINWTDKNGLTTPKKAMLWANRNGFVYTLDRTTGQFLMGKPFVKVTWATGLDEVGRPMRVKSQEPTQETVKIYPSIAGGTNWYSPSFSPRTGLLYVPTWESVYANVTKADQEFVEGKRYFGGTYISPVPGLNGGQIKRTNDNDGIGMISAIDPKTGEKKWQFKLNDVTMSGILTTASDLLFTGDREGLFHALDARDGKELWKVNSGAEIAMGPITYSVNGNQYVAYSAGTTLFVYGLK